METNFASMDLEIRLEPSDSDCPANFIEMLGKRDHYHIDVVSTKDRICWSKNNNILYVWDFVGKGPAKQLHLNSTELQDNARLFLAFNDTNRSDASALALNIEGSARWWASVNSQNHIDTAMIDELLDEVPIGLHLIEKSTKGAGPFFAIMTSTGTALTMELQPNGTFQSKRIAAKPESRRFSFFSPGRKPKRTDFKLSVHFRVTSERGESYRDLLVAIAPEELKAVDVTRNIDLWHLKASSLEGHLSDRIKGVQGELVVKFIDAKAYQDGLVAFVCAHGDFSEQLQFFLVQIHDVDVKTPVFGTVISVNFTAEMLERIRGIEEEDFDVGRPPNSVRLVIPEKTATSVKITTTDGILLVHDTFVHSVFPLSNRNRSVALQLSYPVPYPRHTRIIGYGCDGSLLHVVNNQGTVDIVRVLPKEFPKSRDQPMIEHTISEIKWPNRTVEFSLVKALLAFAKKEMDEAATVCEEKLLGLFSASDLLSTFRKTLWKVAADLDPSGPNFPGQVHDKARFFHFSLLFLKYFGILEKIVDVDFRHPLTGQILRGSEATTEVLERLRVAENLDKWSTRTKPLVGDSTTDEEDFLRDLIRRILPGQAQVEHWRLLDYQHNLPNAALAALDEVIQKMGQFKKVDDICQALYLFGDYFERFAEGIRIARNSIQWLKKDRPALRWTTEIYALIPELCLSYLERMKNPVFSVECKKIFLKYVMNLTAIELRERSPQRPENHKVLLKLIEREHVKEALDLAETFKDFSVLCRILLTYNEEHRHRAVNAYKEKYIEDDFEKHYLNYLVDNREYQVLLGEKGEMAKTFIESISDICWIRDIQNGDMLRASAGLLEEAKREKESLRKRDAFLSLGLLATLATDEEEDYDSDKQLMLTFGKRKVEFQKTIPREIFQMIYNGQGENPLNVEELHELAKLIVEDEACSVEMFKEVIAYGGALKFVRDSIPENTRGLLVFAWQKAIAKNNWRRVTKTNLYETVFAKVVKLFFEEDPEITCAVLPSTDLIVRIAPEIQKSPAWDTISSLLAHAKNVAENWRDTGIPPI